MATEAAYGSLDPNSGNQRWSRWRFVVQPGRRLPRTREVRNNWQRYMPKLFRTTVGRGRVAKVWVEKRMYYAITAEVEGPPVHDPDFVAWVRREVQGVFVERGFGVGARLREMDAVLLAGSAEDGKPASQLLVLPSLIVQ
jgi:hypothetical protein